MTAPSTNGMWNLALLEHHPWSTNRCPEGRADAACRTDRGGQSWGRPDGRPIPKSALPEDIPAVRRVAGIDVLAEPHERAGVDVLTWDGSMLVQGSSHNNNLTAAARAAAHRPALGPAPRGRAGRTGARGQAGRLDRGRRGVRGCRQPRLPVVARCGRRRTGSRDRNPSPIPWPRHGRPGTRDRWPDRIGDEPSDSRMAHMERDRRAGRVVRSPLRTEPKPTLSRAFCSRVGELRHWKRGCHRERRRPSGQSARTRCTA